MSPSDASRELFLAARACPLSRSTRLAPSRSPPDSSSAFLTSIMPAAVSSRSCFIFSIVLAKTSISPRSPRSPRSLPKAPLQLPRARSYLPVQPQAPRLPRAPRRPRLVHQHRLPRWAPAPRSQQSPHRPLRLQLLRRPGLRALRLRRLQLRRLQLRALQLPWPPPPRRPRLVHQHRLPRWAPAPRSQQSPHRPLRLQLLRRPGLRALRLRRPRLRRPRLRRPQPLQPGPLRWRELRRPASVRARGVRWRSRRIARPRSLPRPAPPRLSAAPVGRWPGPPLPLGPVRSHRL